MNSSENSLKSFFDEQTELGANGQSAASRFVRWLISSLAFPFLTDEKHVNLARKIPQNQRLDWHRIRNAVVSVLVRIDLAPISQMN